MIFKYFLFLLLPLLTISLYITSCASVSQRKEREDYFCSLKLLRINSKLIVIPAATGTVVAPLGSPDRILQQDAPDHLPGVRDQVLRISDHVVRAAQHVEAVVAAPSHQMDVVLEVPQAVPLGDLPQGLAGLFLIAKDQAVYHFGIGNGPAFDRPHAAHGGQYHRYQQAHNLHDVACLLRLYFCFTHHKERRG